jgi:hypothetical protein
MTRLIESVDVECAQTVQEALVLTDTLYFFAGFIFSVT